MALSKGLLTSLAFPENKVRLVLIGKTGVGKSSAGNTILGSELFPPVRGFKSGTEKCNWKFVDLKDLTIEVTDTPGVCDTHRTKEDIQKEIAKCVATVTPGPHAVLMVFKGGDRFTHEEGLAYEELKEIFGPELVKHMILVFTGTDNLERDDIDLPTAVQSAPDKLQQVLQEASGRYVGFNNKASWPERAEQRDQLLKVVRQVLKNNNDNYYSNELMKMFEKTMQEVEAKSHQDREHIKEDVVNENSSFLGRFFENVKNFVSKHLCEIM
ncbi:GTPase IMAP family member 4-like [Pomacea canaliculata]|uniref:GTPase IMAP family member 4-like n=1 Tax=Pomacea canaliculata TaxID=400727 RepID=UPI000D727892|nr:GTPase IMAP family member 4-like [Pomacea canaliculata]